MSKSTKIIAALGVAAGLGVAALPMASFATAGQSVEGKVLVGASVNDAIAMTIAGNNDAAELKNVSTLLASGETQAAGDVYNPSGATTIGNWSVSGSSVVGTDTKVSSSWTSLLPNASVHGGTTTGAVDFKSTVTVYTNANGGFILTLADADSDTDLDQVGGTASIATGTSVAAGTSAWGYRTGTAATADTDPYVTIKAAGSEDTINTYSTGATPAAGVATDVFYGVSTSASQATGDYYDIITYTATAQN